MPRFYGFSKSDVGCHCGKLAYDENNDLVPEEFFTSCNICKGTFKIHDKCRPINPGHGKRILIDLNELLSKFVCNNFQSKECSCGKIHHRTELGAFVAKCNIGTDKRHWFYTLPKCTKKTEARKKGWKCPTCEKEEEGQEDKVGKNHGEDEDKEKGEGEKPTTFEASFSINQPFI